MSLPPLATEKVHSLKGSRIAGGGRARPGHGGTVVDSAVPLRKPPALMNPLETEMVINELVFRDEARQAARERRELQHEQAKMSLFAGAEVATSSGRALVDKSVVRARVGTPVSTTIASLLRLKTSAMPQRHSHFSEFDVERDRGEGGVAVIAGSTRRPPLAPLKATGPFNDDVLARSSSDASTTNVAFGRGSKTKRPHKGNSTVSLGLTTSGGVDETGFVLAQFGARAWLDFKRRSETRKLPPVDAAPKSAADHSRRSSSADSVLAQFGYLLSEETRKELDEVDRQRRPPPVASEKHSVKALPPSLQATYNQLQRQKRECEERLMQQIREKRAKVEQARRNHEREVAELLNHQVAQHTDSIRRSERRRQRRLRESGSDAASSDRGGGGDGGSSDSCSYPRERYDATVAETAVAVTPPASGDASDDEVLVASRATLDLLADDEDELSVMEELLLERDFAAVIIQRGYRCYQARKKSAAHRNQRKRAAESKAREADVLASVAAARLIQRFLRCWKANRTLDERVRARLVPTISLVAEARDVEVVFAATMIQRAFRERRHRARE